MISLQGQQFWEVDLSLFHRSNNWRVISQSPERWKIPQTFLFQHDDDNASEIFAQGQQQFWGEVLNWNFIL